MKPVSSKIRSFFCPWMGVFLFFLFPLASYPEEGSAGGGTGSSGVSLSGFVDLYYSYNFNKPASGLNGLSNFDFYSRAFGLNLAELVVEKRPEPVGARLDLDFGPTTEWVHGYTSLYAHPPAHNPGENERLFFSKIQQAYLSGRIGDLLVEGGKFVTHMGLEVIETKDNWNYTRSLGFAYAIPYYHSGIRLSYPLGSLLTLKGYLYNGWNNVLESTNLLKTGGATITFSPAETLGLTFNWIGPESSPGAFKAKHVVEGILSYTASDSLAFSAIGDYGFLKTDAEPSDSQSYLAVGGYARLSLSNSALAVRYEFTRDPEGAMYGLGLTDPATGSPIGPTVQEVTLTLEHTIEKSLLLRLELRSDFADREIFEGKGNQEPKRSQTRVVLGSVVSW